MRVYTAYFQKSAWFLQTMLIFCLVMENINVKMSKKCYYHRYLLFSQERLDLYYKIGGNISRTTRRYV